MTSVLHPMSSLAPEPAPTEPPTFRAARDLLLELDDRYMAAKTTFAWPRPENFNWALDWFDAELAAGDHGGKVALKVIGETVETRTFAELSRQSSQLANGLRSIGAKRGDRLLMMLGNTPELWVTMLAAMKLGLVLIPAMPQLGEADIADRIERGRARFLVARRAGRGEVRQRRRRIRAYRRRRDASRLALLRFPARRQRPLSAGRADAGRRLDAALLHLGHDRPLEARPAQPCELPDRASVDHVRARA